MAEEKSLESIKVVNASALPEATRIKHGFEKDDFIEIRVERVNPASITLVKLQSTPAKKFSSLLKDANF